MFSISYHLLKGSRFKKGVCCWGFMFKMFWSEIPTVWLVFSEGHGVPSWPPPSLQFKGTSVAPLESFPRFFWMCKQCCIWLLQSDAEAEESNWDEWVVATPSTVILWLKVKHCGTSDESANPFVPISNSPSCWSRFQKASLHTSIPAPDFLFFLCFPIRIFFILLWVIRLRWMPPEFVRSTRVLKFFRHKGLLSYARTENDNWPGASPNKYKSGWSCSLATERIPFLNWSCHLLLLGKNSH